MRFTENSKHNSPMSDSNSLQHAQIIRGQLALPFSCWFPHQSSLGRFRWEYGCFQEQWWSGRMSRTLFGRHSCLRCGHEGGRQYGDGYWPIEWPPIGSFGNGHHVNRPYACSSESGRLQFRSLDWLPPEFGWLSWLRHGWLGCISFLLAPSEWRCHGSWKIWAYHWFFRINRKHLCYCGMLSLDDKLRKALSILLRWLWF